MGCILTDAQTMRVVAQSLSAQVALRSDNLLGSIEELGTGGIVDLQRVES